MAAGNFFELGTEVLALVEPVVDRQRLVTVAQLRAGGEWFEALHDLTLIANDAEVTIPTGLRTRVLDAVDGLPDRVAEEVRDIRAALAAVTA